MTKNKKIILLVLGSVAGVVVALIVLVSVLMTPERVRAALVPLAEDMLDRQVELGAIDVSLFSGITLENFSIREKVGRGNFVSADKAVLRYNLLPVLMLKVEIDEISLVKPRIEIIRNEDGSFNFTDLAGTDRDAGAGENSSSSGEETAIDLQISQVNIVDGQLLFRDQSVKGKSEPIEVNAFQLKARDVSIGKNFPLELRADWNGNAFGLDGDVNLGKMAGDFSARFNKVETRIVGGIKDEIFKAVISLPKTTLADLFDSVPKEFDPGLAASGLQGSLTFSAELDGETLRTSGFEIEVNDQVVRLDLNASNLFDDIVSVKFKAASDSLLVDKILPASAESDKSAKDTNRPPLQQEIGPFHVPLDLSGYMQIKKAVYHGIPVNDLILAIALQKNVLRLESLKVLIASGQFRQSGSVNLGVKGCRYTTGIELNGVDGADLVRIFKPELSDSIAGVLSGTVNLSGAGTLPESVKKNLSGNGTLRLVDGKLQNIPALTAVANLLEVGALRQVVLDDGEMQFAIKDGLVNLDSRIAGSTTRLITGGQVGLDGRLNLRSSLALSPELGGRLHEQGRLARYLGDEKGWTTVPIRIKGSYANPDVGLDSAGLKKQAEETVKKEVQKKIEKEVQRGLQKLLGN